MAVGDGVKFNPHHACLAERMHRPKRKTPVLPAAGEYKIVTGENIFISLNIFIAPKLTNGG